jgi:iron complex transport system substrate-binding protein
MPASALALAAEAAVRAASLNLCTDELLLLLAEPRQIVSVSHLSRDPLETSLWARGRRHRSNSGTLEGVARQRPNLLLTMGASGGGRMRIAGRLGMRVLDLPYPASPDDVVAHSRTVARALGRPAAAEPYAAALRRLRATAPPLRDGAFVSHGGSSLAPGGLSAAWLSLAGFRQPALPGNRLTLERLATMPPKWLIISDYRQRQQSRGQAWLSHPLVRRLEGRTLRTDGRAWTCGGLPMLAEVARLRQAAAR